MKLLALTSRLAQCSRNSVWAIVPVSVALLTHAGPARLAWKGLSSTATGMLVTNNGRDKDGQSTQGGYSMQIVVDENYVLRLPTSLSAEGAAPLPCAGITIYSPLRHWGPGKYHKLAVVGLGGLGHMAVKIARAMGTEVTVLSTSERKRRDAERLDAAHFAVTSHATTFSQLQRRFEFILNTVSAPHNYNAYLNLLKPTAP